MELTISLRSQLFLKEFGWTTERLVSIDTALAAIAARGFKINIVAEKVLTAFSGIQFTTSSGSAGWFRFDHQECFHTFRLDQAANLEALIGSVDPCPIGGGGGYILFAFPCGKFALLHEQWIFLTVAESFASITEAIVFGDLTDCHVFEDVEAYRPD